MNLLTIRETEVFNSNQRRPAYDLWADLECNSDCQCFSEFMKKKEAQTESSIKIALKIKAFEREEVMLKQAGFDHVVLTDEKSGKSEEFEYDQIFDIRKSNENVYEYLKQSTVGRVFDNTNCCMVCIGQAGSGKSFTLFGNDARLGMNPIKTDYNESTKNIGIIQKIYDGLVESSLDFQDNKEYQIVFSMLEVQKENVHDLLVGFEDAVKSGVKRDHDDKNARQSLENLEVYESANGQLMIKNLSSYTVNSEEELVQLIAYGVYFIDKE
jgi:Kinesin motor domain